MAPIGPSLRDKLAAGDLVLCLALVQARTADVPVMAAACGYDAIYVDLEHASVSLDTASLLCASAIGAGISPLVRVPSHQPEILALVLDGGAIGVIVPHVETEAEAEMISDACRFPPRGHRSISGTNLITGYQPLAQAAVLERLNRETVVAVMIETPGAVDRADAIAAVDGVDMLFIGPHDLTAEIGILGRFEDHRFTDAVTRVANACAAHGKAMGIAGIAEQVLLRQFVDLGLQFISAGSDAGLFRQAATARSTELRALATAPATETRTKQGGRA